MKKKEKEKPKVTAHEYISRYAAYKNAIQKLAREAAALEQVAYYQLEEKLKQETLAKAKSKKQKIQHLMDLQEDIRKTVRNVSQDRARILELHYYYGDSFREIARNQNRRPEWIRMKHDEGMNQLQNILDMRERARAVESKYGIFDAETQHMMKGTRA